jgi:hypothetical protein
MLIPVPLPAYTLAPDIGPLTPEQESVLHRCLVSLTGRLPGVIVTGVRTTEDHQVLEMATAEGPLLVLERATAPVA